MAKEWVKNMTRANSLGVLAICAATAGLVACGNEQAEQNTDAEPVAVLNMAPEVSFKPGRDKYQGTTAKPGSPYSISYRIIGAPVVGSPVIVDLRLASNAGSQPMRLDYRINDATSMLLGASQPASVLLEPAANETSFTQQVTIVPQREGRFYLNVSASFETADGTVSTVTAIPIQVGSGSRELQDHGIVQTDENGEAIRVLSDN